MSPPRSEASAKHSQDAEVAQEEREQAPSARSAGSDKSAPSVAQRVPEQARKHRKRSYAGEAARCLPFCVLHKRQPSTCALGQPYGWGDQFHQISGPGRKAPNNITRMQQASKQGHAELNKYREGLSVMRWEAIYSGRRSCACRV